MPSKSAESIVQEDLDFICEHLEEEFANIRGRKLLVTGGAGFLGYYLIQSVLHLNKRLSAADQVSITVYDNFIRGLPAWLSELDVEPRLKLVRHDITLPLPEGIEAFDYIIHAASIASPLYYRKYPIETMDASNKVAFVDMAGNRSVLETLHHHFQDNMVCSCGVGITHWESRDGSAPAKLPGAKPEMFFAPTQIQKRLKASGPEKLQADMAAAWDGFLGSVDNWVSINERSGRDAIASTYQEVLNGAAPNQSFALAL